MAVTGDIGLEYEAIATGCALVDRSERGKLAFTGGEAKAFLQGQVSNDIEALVAGSGCYAALLTPKGKMLGDLRILDRGHELLIDTERSALQSVFTTLHRHRIGFDAELHKRTLECGLLSLLGPRARAIAGAPELAREEHANAAGEIAGVPVTLAATDLGVDVICPSEQTAEVQSALVAAGALPVSEEAAECARIESGRPRYGLDIDDSTIPQEAGLNERAVSFTKGCYVGQETVARLFYKGKPNRRLAGLRLSEPAEPGEPLMHEGREVGRLGSVARSPRLGPIALALVRREAPDGARVLIGGGAATAVVEPLPFAAPAR